MIIVRVALLLLTGTLTNAWADSGDALRKIDQYVATQMREQHIPGVEVGIYRHGKVVLAKGYGSANVELNVPVRPDMVFQSGSMGKQFTATGIMILVQEGRVSLEDSITRYFPDAPPTCQSIKVKNLLSHTSGLGQYSSHERTRPFGPFNLQQEVTEDEVLKRIEAMRIDFPVGERWLYCDTNYVLLGILIHKVTGQSYGDFLAERIFKPLGMTATRIISDAEIIPNRVAGYRLDGATLRNQSWVAPFYNSTGDGAIYFNVPDLAKWDAALYTETLLRKSSLEQMWTPFVLNNGERNIGHYGFGWFIQKIHGHKVIEHEGGWQGFTTHIARYVDTGITVVVLSNLASGDSPKMAHEIAGLYDPDLTPDPDTDAPPAWLKDYDSV